MLGSKMTNRRGCCTPMSRPPKATIYQNYFLPLRHFSKRHCRDSLYHRSNNKPRLVQSQSLCHYCPTTLPSTYDGRVCFYRCLSVNKGRDRRGRGKTHSLKLRTCSVFRIFLFSHNTPSKYFLFARNRKRIN